MRFFVKVQEPRTILRSLAVVAVMFGTANSSQAQIKITAPPTITPVAGGLYEWDFFPVLTAGSTMNYGDYFTIYDFDGFVPVSQTSPSAGWSATTNGTGIKLGTTPPGFTPTDDPTLYNLNWMFVWNPVTATNSDLSLGKFSALTPYGGAKDGIYSQKSHTSEGGLASGLGTTFVPDRNGVFSDGIGDASVAPEPSSLALLLGGASVFPVLRLCRRGSRRTARR